MPTTRAHRFCDTQSTTSFTLFKIQLIIPPMIPGNASSALNWPNRNASALSLFLIYSFKLASSLGAGSPPDAAAPPPPPPGNNSSTSTPMAILTAVSMEAIVIPCSLNRVRIFSMRCYCPIL